MRWRLCALLLLVVAVGGNNDLSFSPGAADEGTQYTILLHPFTGPDHVSESRRWKERTVDETGWDDMYIVHRDDRSLLHRGRYDSIEAAQPDLEQVKEYTTEAGIPPYTQALVIPLPGQHVGPPEWHLGQARGTWTVKVAEFYDVPEQDYVGRRQFAVDYCERLRDNGYEAFYAHGSAESYVYIGDFPENAVAISRDGDRQRLNIRDPRMQQIMEDFPQLAVNGSGERVRHYDARTGQAELVDRRSHPVRIATEGEDPSEF